MKTTLTVLAVLCMATVANAGINFTTSTPVDLGGGLYSTVLSVSATGPDLFQAMDLTFTGTLNQVKFGTIKAPTLDIGSMLANPALDTHFLFYNNVPTDDFGVPLPGAIGMTTTSVTTGMANLLDLATGTRGVATLTGDGSAVAAMDIIQLVGPAGTIVMTGEFANATGAKFASNGNIVLPEPATMSLLGLGVAALIRRRK